MSNSRKIQSEIDRLLKKINEGMEVYEEVYEKFSSAPNQALKERFEGDLKKEIKKLQRLREQIKTLLTGGEVKDKKALESARRNIELKMEAFKVCERETKTKAFSKEGLAAGGKSDPADQAKAETAAWIKSAISDLGEQIESLEYDLEQDAARKRKGTQNDPKEDRMIRSKFHVVKLEQLLRMLENEELSPEDIDAIQDDVQGYVDNNMEEDYVEEFEDLYDCFDLPEAPPPRVRGEDDSDEEKTSKVTPKTKKEEVKPKKEEGGRVVVPKKEGELTPPTGAAKPTPKSQAKKEVPVPASKAKEVPSPASAPAVVTAAKKQPPAVDGKPKLTMAAAIAPKTPTAAPGKTAAKAPASPAREAPSALSTPYATVVQSSNAQGSAAARMAAEQPGLDSLMDEDDDALNDDTFGDDAMPIGGPGSLADMAGMTAGAAWDKSKPLPPKPAAERLPPKAVTASPPAQSATHAVPQPSAQTSSQASAHLAAAAMLEQSARNLPHPNDCERLKPYVPPNPFKTPAWYPQAVHPALSSADTLAKFEIEALFFIFYYQPNTYQQYLAAKELKKQSWRYHKRYLTWFQRHDTPKQTTDEFEQGAYIYFDYESGWCQRIKNDFTFKYTYLEDELH